MNNTIKKRVLLDFAHKRFVVGQKNLIGNS